MRSKKQCLTIVDPMVVKKGRNYNFYIWHVTQILPTVWFLMLMCEYYLSLALRSTLSVVLECHKAFHFMHEIDFPICASQFLSPKTPLPYDDL